MNALDRAKALAIKAESTKWPDGFKEDFLIVAKHYECSPEEQVEMKRAAKHDIGNAVICYRAIVEEIS